MEFNNVLLIVAVAYTVLSILAFLIISSVAAPKVAFEAVQARPVEQHSQSRDNILLVIAHPDDEAMFFVPSLQHLKQYFNVHVLCLSNGRCPAGRCARWAQVHYICCAGGFDGLGATREKELYASCISLGLDRQHVTVLDEPDLRDGMQANWPPAVVARHVQHYVAQHHIQAVRATPHCMCA